MYLTSMLPTWGQCIPSGCTTEETTTHFYLMYEEMNALVYPIIGSGCQTQEKQDERLELETMNYVAM